MKELYGKLATIVGPEYVSDQPEERYIYSMDPGTMPPAAPDLVVMPSSTEEVRRIMQVANRQRIPMITAAARETAAPFQTRSDTYV